MEISENPCLKESHFFSPGEELSLLKVFGVIDRLKRLRGDVAMVLDDDKVETCVLGKWHFRPADVFEKRGVTLKAFRLSPAF